MIRESEFFSFAGRKSTDFNIFNVSVDEGMFNEPLIAGKTINEVKIRGRRKPYFIDVEEDPKELTLRFAFGDTWDDRLIDEVTRWLNVDYYEPLFFSENINKVFYVMPVDGIDLIHNGLKQGYIELKMRCDSGNSYSHDIVTPIYQPEEKDSSDTKDIEIDNYGHYPFYPQLWIEKIDGKDIVIYNRTNGNQEFRFKNIEKGEGLFVDCENEIIKTDKEGTYRYDDFNDNYLEIIYGRNVLNISNNARYQFKYKYIFS